MINRHQLKATNLLSLQIFNLKFKLESQSIFITKHINTYIVFYFNLAKIFFFYWKLKSIIIKFFSNFFVSFFNSFWMFFWRINPIQDGLFRGCSWAPPLPKICHTYPTVMKLGKFMPYPKMIQKIYESRDTAIDFCWHHHFFIRNQQILLYQEIQI